MGGLSPNLGPIIIATLLEQQGHHVEVISEYVTKLYLKEIVEADLVGISIHTYNAQRGFEIARELKKPIVFGGSHASLMPQECLKYGDYAMIGDGHSIVDLVDFLDNRRIDNISQVSNLVYKAGDEIIYNQKETKTINIIPNFNFRAPDLA